MPSIMAFLAVSITVMPGSASTVCSEPSGWMKVIFTIGAKTPRLENWARGCHCPRAGPWQSNAELEAIPPAAAGLLPRSGRRSVNGPGRQIQARCALRLLIAKHLLNLPASGLGRLADRRESTGALSLLVRGRGIDPLGQFRKTLQMPGADRSRRALDGMGGQLPVGRGRRCPQAREIEGCLGGKQFQHLPFQTGVAQGEAGTVVQVDGRLDHRWRRRRHGWRRQLGYPPRSRPLSQLSTTPGRSLSAIPEQRTDRAAGLQKVALTSHTGRALASRKVLPSPSAGGPRRAKSCFCPIAPIARRHARGTCGGDRPGKRHGWLITVFPQHRLCRTREMRYVFWLMGVRPWTAEMTGEWSRRERRNATPRHARTLSSSVPPCRRRPPSR